MASRRLLYIESDGQVFLVERDGQWTFPREGDALDFKVQVRHATRIVGHEVAFCRPLIDYFPADWVFKDDVPLRKDIDPVVQRAINASLPRCVVGVVLMNEAGQVLLVKSSRGFTKGMWNVPGGFIEYGETPDVAAAREAKEETGLDIQVGELLGVFMERFESPYFMYGFMYDAKTGGGELRPDPSEIEETRWFSPEEAMASTINPFALQAMARRFGKPVPDAVVQRHKQGR
jgi:8-oxo-dGTP diphosphatase